MDQVVSRSLTDTRVKQRSDSKKAIQEELDSVLAFQNIRLNEDETFASVWGKNGRS
ncbi:hypothetical protein BaRGS_00007145, partial [Batillaria attramentaria]